jgi:hypothetical protein
MKDKMESIIFKASCRYRIEIPAGYASEFKGWGPITSLEASSPKALYRYGMVFVVYRPYGESGECGEPYPTYDVKDLVLFVGKCSPDILVRLDDIMEFPLSKVEIFNAKRLNEEVRMIDYRGREFTAIDNRTLTIESKIGKFYLPDPWTKELEHPIFYDDSGDHRLIYLK